MRSSQRTQLITNKNRLRMLVSYPTIRECCPELPPEPEGSPNDIERLVFNALYQRGVGQPFSVEYNQDKSNEEYDVFNLQFNNTDVYQQIMGLLVPEEVAKALQVHNQ